MNNFEKPNRIEELEKKLYSPNQQFEKKPRKPLNHKEFDVAQDWPTQHLDQNKKEDYFIEEKKPNWFFRLFIVALIFFIGAGAYLGVTWFLNSGTQGSNVDILVNAPLTIGAGESLNFEVTLQNKNATAMKYVEIQIQYPDGTRSISDISEELRFATDKVESIAVGEIVKKNYSALLFGEENEQKEITVFLTYQVEESTQLFKKEKKFDVVLSSTPIRLTVTNVKETTAGQDLEFTVELVSNSSQTLKDILVQAVYPFGFNFKSSSLSVAEDKKTWKIDTLAPKETVTFKVRGSIDGQNRDDKYFKFLVGLKDPESDQMQLTFTSKDTLVAITRPFLELDMGIDNDNSDIIVLDPDVNRNAKISYKNNTEFPLRNALISLKLDGASIAKDSVRVNGGFYQSLTNLITWDNTTADDLISIPVGKSGEVSFGFVGVPVSSTNIITNPEATFTINVKANRNPQNQVADTIENSIIKKIRFNTRPTLQAESTFYSNIFANSGPIPPKVEQKTTYTATLTLKNTTNALGNGVVTMRIPNYVQYEGMYAPSNESVSYDAVTRTITWNVGTIPAKTGYVGTGPRKLNFQVSIIPSISQSGSSPTLVDNINFVGVDTFTQKEITTTAPNITTSIFDSKDYYSSQVSR